MPCGSLKPRLLLALASSEGSSAAPALVRVLPQQLQYGLETWVVMHEDLRTSPRCKHTFDALVVGLERYLVEGLGSDESAG